MKHISIHTHTHTHTSINGQKNSNHKSISHHPNVYLSRNQVILLIRMPSNNNNTSANNVKAEGGTLEINES
jgi:hypothetical protein